MAMLLFKQEQCGFHLVRNLPVQHRRTGSVGLGGEEKKVSLRSKTDFFSTRSVLCIRPEAVSMLRWRKYKRVVYTCIDEPTTKNLKLVTSVSNYTVHGLHFVNHNGLVCSTEAPTICFWFNLLRLLIRGHTVRGSRARRERDAIADFWSKEFLVDLLGNYTHLPVSIGRKWINFHICSIHAQMVE